MAAKYDNVIPYIKKAEGGLSRALTDSASKNPAPWAYNGKTGWHTNKGVQYLTFKDMASVVGYENNAANFFTMPDNIWIGIFKEGYWKPMKCDLYDSQAIANTVVDFAWASGVGGARKLLIDYLKSKGIFADGSITISQGLNSLVKKDGEAKAFNDLIDYRKQSFKNLNQPANLPGWLSRMEQLRKQGLSVLSETFTAASESIKKKPLESAAIALAITATIILLYISIKKLRNKPL